MSPPNKTRADQYTAYEQHDASQEDQYTLPYHFIPSLEHGHFRQHLYWSWGFHYLATIELVLDLLGQELFDSLIDIGCGDGRFLREANKRFSGKKMLGVDSSLRAVNLARAMSPQLNFECVDICDGRSEIASFDVVTLVEVLEHIPVDFVYDFVNASANLQKQHGRLILTVPHKNKPVPRKHYQHFDGISLKRLLERHYVIEHMIFFDKRTRIFKNIIHNLLANKFFILNNGFLLDVLYRIYRNYYFFCSENQCGRICVVGRKKC